MKEKFWSHSFKNNNSEEMDVFVLICYTCSIITLLLVKFRANFKCLADNGWFEI
jgi:hypothetical protein